MNTSRTHHVARALLTVALLFPRPIVAAQTANPAVDIAALRQAAESGDLMAMFRLGVAYRDGTGVAQDLVQAHAWVAQAAILTTGADEKTYLAAAQQLAGRMTEAQLDEAEKRRWDQLQRLGAGGHAGAQFLVGMMFYTGHRLVPQDFARAAESLRKAANQGERKAQFMLANMYVAGEGVPRDEVQGIQWHMKSAAQGFPDAQYMLGFAYSTGTGAAEDQTKAVEWFRMAADQGDRRAQFRLGVAYGYGRGAVQDQAQALQWFRKSAEQNYPEAQFELGVLYEDGRGVAVDGAEAVKWYGLAAEQGNPLAQFNLGRLYAYGRGIAQDYVEAYKWANLAAARAPSEHQKQFADGRDGFAQSMTAEQIGEAQKRARAWLEAFEKRR